MSRRAEETVDHLFNLLGGEPGQEQYGEGVTQLEHALQCAKFAADAAAGEEAVVAALLHDIGHLIVGDLYDIDDDLPRDFHHERAGAAWLARAFPESVSEPVRLHVAAKRYLCHVDPTYLTELTPSSERSLRVQGGPMSAAEAAAFEAGPWFAEAVQVRRLDEAAKVADCDVADLATYVPLLRRLVVAAGRAERTDYESGASDPP